MLTESKTHWNNKHAKDKFRNIIAQRWKGASVTTVETNLPWHLIYKPGGTSIITDIPIRSRKTQSGEDSHGLGRWSIIILQGQEERNLTNISVYKVCSTTIDHTKTDTALTQKWTILQDALEGKYNITNNNTSRNINQQAC